MHILVAALLALSCFIPVFGSLSSGDVGPADSDVQSERTMPDFDDRSGDFSFDGDRLRSDRSDADLNDQNGGADQNGSDVDGQTDGQSAPDGATQNGDRSNGKRFNRTPDGQSGTTTPGEGVAPDGSATPGNGEAAPNSDAPAAQGTA